ncbi:interleukin-12 receptor subunit beta-2-like isoform X1 [Bufo bufo]|uniref:interleukin-12 receptor subunit beta-2-like isoform X1 n=2 Tax=Bufo bufo TaxID=8384 RepID=UPI001ABD9E1D|nr:interleukin-12 receptor subunit beta-2-like isoform X1 [Bufo bufo]XP_040263070.1 interleukin-12 receptor subunit beta-2-like isoform X1 [Bufo bufo]
MCNSPAAPPQETQSITLVSQMCLALLHRVVSPSFQLMERRFWILWLTVNITIVLTLMRSSAETCSAAIMKVNPGTVIHHGHPINLTCTLTGNFKSCNRGSKEDMNIFRQKSDSSLPGALKADSVAVRDLPPPGETVYLCWKCKLLCVISVFAGFPPDKPKSVTCEQEGELGKISCTWESRRETFIETICTLQLLQKTHNVTVSSKCSSQANQSLSLPVSVAVGGEYTVLVRAANELGENVSMPYVFTYIDVVKPYPPRDITVTCDTSHNCTVTVHDNQDVQHCRLRYRVTNESSWEQAEILSNRSLILNRLHPQSEYELQAACKYVIDKGKWSNWSKVVTHETPEDAPRGMIYVWYNVHRTNKTVTIFWKYMNLSEFRGQIQFYQVIFQDNERRGVDRQNTRNTWLSRNVDTEGCVISVSAHNSMGSSPPAYITVTTRSLSGLAAPKNVIAISGGPDNITLRWELPPGVDSSGDQIVVWEDPTGMDQNYANWIRVPKNNRSVTVSGHLKPNVCYQFYVYLLWGGRAGLPGVTQGSTKQTAPLTAPKFKYGAHKENTILVTWEEIPAEAWMGCITHYSIYLKAISQTTRVIKISVNQSAWYQYEIDNIEKNIQYSLEMTCSNDAGEGPPSPLISAYVQPDVSEDITAVSVFVAILIFVGFLLSISFAKLRVQILSKILPRGWSKPVPDPANCEWAKEYISKKEKREVFTRVASSVSNYDDETETVEIEEMTSQEEAEEGPASVFSYKIDIASIRITHDENITPKENSEGTAQGGTYTSLETDQTPSDYLLHHEIKPFDYLLHHEIKPSDYLVHHKIKQSDYLVHHEIKPSDYLMHHKIEPSDYLSHHIKQSDDLAHHEMRSSDCLVHQDIKLLNLLVAHCNSSDYLAHHEIKPSDPLLHQDVKISNSTVSHIEPSSFLAHNETKVDYLPTNMLTITEDPKKEEMDLFHHQLFLPSGERCRNTISLNTVQLSIQ